MFVRRRIDQLNIYSQPVPGTLDAAFEYPAYAEFATDFGYCLRRIAIALSRRSGNHLESGNPGQTGQQAILYADRQEIGGGSICAQVRKGQDRD